MKQDTAQFVDSLLSPSELTGTSAKPVRQVNDELPDMLEFISKLGAMGYICEQCGALIGFKYNVIGQHWVYCSNACRQKAYRIRHGQRYSRPGRPKKS